MTVRRGYNDSELPAFASLARESRLTVRFSEYLRQEDEAAWKAEFVPAAEIRARLLEQGCALEPRTGVTRSPLPGGGSLEVAAPVSEPELKEWRHLQVSAEGRLVSVSRHTHEEDLRPWLGSPELDERVRDAVQRVGR